MTATTTTHDAHMTATTATTDTQSLILDHAACIDAIAGLQTMLADRSIYEMDEHDHTDFAAFAKGAVGLAHLATALHEYRSTDHPLPPYRKGDARSLDALRAQVAVTLSEPWTPTPVMASGETMRNFVWGLRKAVESTTLYGEEDVTQEAADALFRLGCLAEELSQAARAAGGQIQDRVHALQAVSTSYTPRQANPATTAAARAGAAAAFAVLDSFAEQREGTAAAEGGAQAAPVPTVRASGQRCGAPIEGDATGAPEADADRERRA